MAFQVASVAKPIGSVKRLWMAGHAVVFAEDVSYILTKATGEINWLRKENYNYMLDAWVPHQSYFGSDNGQPFGRQP